MQTVGRAKNDRQLYLLCQYIRKKELSWAARFSTEIFCVGYVQMETNQIISSCIICGEIVALIQMILKNESCQRFHFK